MEICFFNKRAQKAGDRKREWST